ncbi:tyrosine-type recombinase/integrase [Pseudoduganella sp. FT55W]|uniref:Tyrosine-type recombinase/integrase n=1 Tax=Duganella rivi TaxID=2666083 RepID=A0A7X4GNG6_9BURK|nr:site-specific integrase [Duganella rivi]MYM66245.1 tyrosine-type recombinase/integrase [Duganella rivi]
MADLTVQAIQKLQPEATYRKYNVSAGLFIGVAASGEKNFIVRYSVNKKQIDYRLPKPFGLKSDAAHISLMDARAKAAEIRALGKQGIDYQKKLEADAQAAAAQQAQQNANNATVQDLYDAWFPTTRRKDGGDELKRYFNRDILPVIGTKVLRELVEGDIKALIAPAAASGTNRKAVVMLNILKQMFKWAAGRRPWKLLVIDNPTENLKPEDVTQIGYKEVERERVLSRHEIKELVTKLPGARLEKTTEVAIWLALSCCTRIGETLMAEWEHIDLDKGIWFLPEPNTKGIAPEHTVFLSDFAKRQFQALKKITGYSKWCFPNRENTSHVELRAVTKQTTGRQVMFSKTGAPLQKRSKAGNALVLGNEKWTPHDLRRTGTTLMQSLGIHTDLTDRILNHVEQNRMKRIYNRFGYDEDKRDAWIKLGALLDDLTGKITVQTHTE